jgi:hypothetical protein
MSEDKKKQDIKKCDASTCVFNDKNGACTSIVSEPITCEFKTAKDKITNSDVKPTKPVQPRMLDSLPEPTKVISLLILVGAFGVVFKYWPMIITSLIGDYTQRNPQDVSPILYGLFGIVAILTLLLMGVWGCRGIWWPFVRAGWTNSVVLAMFTKNKRVSFKVPKEVNWNHIKLDKDSTIDQDPDSWYTSPSKVPMAIAIPDHAKTLDPRGFVINQGKDLSIDINTMDNAMTLSELKGMKKMSNPMSTLLSGPVPWILLGGLVLFLVLWPHFSEQMDQSSKINAYQATILQCNQELVAHSLQPIGVVVATSTTTTLAPNVAKPATSVSNNNNPNNIGK